jgi:subtilisin family serine protease
MVLFLLVVTNCRQEPGLKNEILNGVEVCSEQALVKFNGSADMLGTTIRSGKKFTATATSIEQVGKDIYLVKAPGQSAASILDSLNNFISTNPQSGIVSAEPDFVVKGTVAPNDPLFAAQWGLDNAGKLLPTCPVDNAPQLASLLDADIDAPQAWDTLATIETRPTLVAVLDTGISSAHPDLRDNIWSSVNKCDFSVLGTPVRCPSGCRGYNTFTDECWAEDDHGHGTAVSGVIGAKFNNRYGIAGISPQVRLLSVKVLNGKNEGCVSHVMKAVAFIREIKTRFNLDLKVLNNSYGCASVSGAPAGSCDATYLKEAIDSASESELLFVAAAGNFATNNDCILEGRDDCKAIIPASFDLPNIISVAATNRFENLSYFSNYGQKTVHLGAPGETICTTTLTHPMLEPSFQYLDGTSMSTPFVSAAASLLLSRSGCNLTVAELKESILKSAESVPSLAGKTVTGGRLNVNDALTYSALHFCRQ